MIQNPLYRTIKQINPLKTLKILPFFLVSSLHCSVWTAGPAGPPQPLSDSLLSASLKSQLLTSPYQESGVKL